MATSEYKPVVFQNSLGEEISNDPVWLAQKTLAQYGSLQQLPPAPLTARPQVTGDDEEIDEGDTPEKTYAEMSGKELKALAAERGVDISGLRTVGEVRKALTDDDSAKAAAQAVEDANSGEGNK